MVEVKLTVFVASSTKLSLGRIGEPCKNKGYIVVPMMNEASLLEELTESKADIVFLQGSLAEAANNSLSECLRNNPVFSRVSVVLFSSRPEMALSLPSFGADFFLPLPFKEECLNNLLRKISGISPTLLLLSRKLRPTSELCKSLVQAGFQIQISHSINEGIDIAKSLYPDLILVDQELKDVTGLSCCWKLRENPLTALLPLVFLSAENQAEITEACFEIGVLEILFPPFEDSHNIESLKRLVPSLRHGHNPKSVLVVENAPLMRNLVTRILIKAGFRVSTADNGEEALERIESEIPGVILTDLEMPIMDGWELIYRIRQRSDMREIPIIILSARDDEKSKHKGRLLGVDRYLTKPVKGIELCGAVNSALSETRATSVSKTLARYVSKDLRHSVSTSMDGYLDEKPQERHVTALMTDIVAFTRYFDSFSAREIVDMINRHFNLMVNLLKRHGGIVDKFIGDAILARFDCGDQQQDALNAALAALDMLKAQREYNEQYTPSVFMRIGINSGQVILGNIGSQDEQLDYTMIGDAVNVAARLENAAPEMGCLLSESTYELVKDEIEVNDSFSLPLKHRSHSVTSYQLLGVKRV